MITLNEARKKGDIDRFIQEREAEAKVKGDLDKLDAIIQRPEQGTSKAAQGASKPRSSGD